MFKHNEYAGRVMRIDLQPWLWLLGLLLVLAVILAGQAARYLWRDSLEVEGRVWQFATQEPIADAFVEVVWEEVQAPIARRLYRTVVKTDQAGRYRVRLPDALARPGAGKGRGMDRPAPLRGFTARAYKPGYRHLKSSLLLHYPGAGFNPDDGLAGEAVPSRWQRLDWDYGAQGITIEMEEPDARDRAGEVRLVPVAETDSQRIRQLYGTMIALTLSSGPAPGTLEREWLMALCHEASGLYLIAERDHQLRADLCRAASEDP